MNSATAESEAAPSRVTGTDPIRESFLRAQQQDASALSATSDIVRLHIPANQVVPERYVAQFTCTTLVRASDGTIHETDYAEVGIWFHQDYQRRVEPLRVLSLLEPHNLWHPNVRYPLLCAGHITCATSLRELVFQVWEVLTYRKRAPHDGLNDDACQWARQNQHRFPTDPRPLVGNGGRFDVELVQ